MKTRILVYRLGSIGDAVVALPAFHLIRERFPADAITLLTAQAPNDTAVSLTTVLPRRLFDDILEYPLGTRRIGELRRLRTRIVERRFRLMIALTESRGRWKSVRDYAFFRSCGIPEVRGFPFRGSELACQPEPGAGLYRSETNRLLDRLGWLGSIDVGDARWWDLHLDAEERTAAAAVLGASGVSRPVLAFSIGAKPDTNDWSQDNWRALILALSARADEYALVAIGGPAEATRSRELLALWSGQTANLCGRTSPRVTACVLQRAVLYIGHDSGPLHLAAAVGTRSVAIYSARNPPGQWFPSGDTHTVFYNKTPCFGCGLDTCVTFNKKCILSIGVPQVAEAVNTQLARASCA